ncbi:MAG: TetR/AcrR family transcriptional regulator [Chloroflexi bacterium]|nr:TetR/AcrR family transcriptional regulator [Chloroflexota bacterium]
MLTLSRSAASARRRGDGYHHGDLRRALLEAAAELLEGRGVEGLALREVARRAKVSHTAPYHHFVDKAALVAALVDTGFEQLTRAMLAASSSTDAAGEGNLERLKAIGVAYVQFAIAHPALFRLLCRPEQRTPPSASEATPPTDAGRAAYAVLVDAVQACLASGEVQGDAEALALSAWCIVHGLATLLLDGPLREVASRTELDVDNLAHAVTDTLARGLRPRPSEPGRAAD